MGVVWGWGDDWLVWAREERDEVARGEAVRGATSLNWIQTHNPYV